jgi:hypothetical protein
MINLIMLRYLLMKHKEFIVDEKSAKLDGCETHGLALNHYELNKFSDPKDNNFGQICDLISVLCGKAPELISKRNKGTGPS